MVAELMNAGLLTGSKGADGGVIVGVRRDAQKMFDGPAEVHAFHGVLERVSNPWGVLLRGSRRAALGLLVRESFVAWLESTGLPLGDNLEVQVEVSSCLSDGRFSVIDDADGQETSWVEPLVGLQLCLGEGSTTRAVVCVTDRWFDEVRDAGVVRGGRFFLGRNADGPVYSHLDVVNANAQGNLPVCGWAKLDNGSLEPQDFAGLFEAIPQPFEKSENNLLFVGSYCKWSRRDDKYYIDEGGFPSVVADSYREAESWQIITDFVESFVRMDDLRAYESAQYMDHVDGFNLERDDARVLLRHVVRAGVNPFKFVLPMTSIDLVRDLR